MGDEWLGTYVKHKADTSRMRTAREVGFAGCFGCVENCKTLKDTCSRRGECVFGLCVCQPGAYGLDCAEGTVQGGLPPPHFPAPTSLAIYVYELPNEIAITPLVTFFSRFGSAGDLMYSAELW